MQARENSGDSVTYLEMQREIYPHPSGYRYETGGIMKNLRESITHEKVNKFDKICKTLMLGRLGKWLTKMIGLIQILCIIKVYHDF